jgi:hypothetical protein
MGQAGSQGGALALDVSSPASEEAIKLGCHCASFRRGPDERRLGGIARGVKPLAPNLARCASFGCPQEVLEWHVHE